MKPAHKDIPRPPPRLVLTTPEHLLAFGLGAGLAPRAPGTFGTLAAVPLFLALCWLPLPVYAALTAALFVLGCWACGASARLLQVHDYPGFVFDEIVGYLIACAPLVGAPALLDWPLWAGALAAFAAFRFFDILKPWPIRVLDRHVGGGLGIMLDDAAAGAAAALLLWGLDRLL